MQSGSLLLDRDTIVAEMARAAVVKLSNSSSWPTHRFDSKLFTDFDRQQNRQHFAPQSWSARRPYAVRKTSRQWNTDKAQLESFLAAVKYPQRTRELAKLDFTDNDWVVLLPDLVKFAAACPDPTAAIDKFCHAKFNKPDGKQCGVSKMETKLSTLLKNLVIKEQIRCLMLSLQNTQLIDWNADTILAAKNCRENVSRQYPERN